VILTFILTILVILKSNNSSPHLMPLILFKIVSFHTHQDVHTLDLVITASSLSLSPIFNHSPISSSDHFPIFSRLTISPLPPPPLSTFSFRCLKSINISKFKDDIANSRLITPTNLHDLIDRHSQYHTLRSSRQTRSSKNQNHSCQNSQPLVYSGLVKIKIY